MSTYSIAEARNGLPGLINKAKAGERVTITRRGEAVAELVPIQTEPEKDPRAMHAWLKSRAKRRPLPSGVTSLDILQAMKDEKPW
jgi:prevent-host-death family protein